MEEEDEFKVTEAIAFVVITLLNVSLGTSIRDHKETLTS
jgi:hypothetical protein